MDASKVFSNKTQCERGDISQTWRIYFSNRRWTNQPLGGDRDLRTSTSIRHRPIRGESHLDFLEIQKGLFHHHLTTGFRMPVKQLMISGPCRETS